VHTALLFFSRVLVSVSFAVLLVLTTRHHELLKTLRIFKVPQIFVMTMGMSYRYIFLLLDIIRNTFIAIKSRVGFVVPSYSGRKIATAIMAGLWLRSYRLHGQVYDAMVSRGYSGEPVTMHRFKTKPADIVFLASSILLLTGALWLNRFFH
jgi:cobalt/nickel transport system permease protein